jgi:hypothetical protein
MNNLEYDNELNKRLESRNVPSAPLQPLYDLRPTMTRYTWFQTVDPKIPGQVNYPYDPKEVFNPGQRAPISYFMQNVDKESTLRNQFFALQRSPQKEYVPELNSSLYENAMAYAPEYLGLGFAPTDACTETNNVVPSAKPFYNTVKMDSRK